MNTKSALYASALLLITLSLTAILVAGAFYFPVSTLFTLVLILWILVYKTHKTYNG
jgi:hypothetical protein